MHAGRLSRVSFIAQASRGWSFASIYRCGGEFFASNVRGGIAWFRARRVLGRISGPALLAQRQRGMPARFRHAPTGRLPWDCVGRSDRRRLRAVRRLDDSGDDNHRTRPPDTVRPRLSSIGSAPPSTTDQKVGARVPPAVDRLNRVFLGCKGRPGEGRHWSSSIRQQNHLRLWARYQ